MAKLNWRTIFVILTMETLLKLAIILTILNAVVDCDVFKDYKNGDLVLASVYDAMRNNIQKDMSNNRPDLLLDLRNKRNTNSKENTAEYYEHLPSESQNEWAIINTPVSHDLVCTKRGDHAQTKITVSDHNSGLTTALLIKYGLLLLAVLALPLVLFKLFILPIKILLGLKAISLLNSLLLGSLLLKLKHGKHFRNGSNGYPITGNSLPISSSSSSSSSSVVSPVSPLGNSLQLSDENADYVDVVRPGDDIKRILKYVKIKNPSW